MESLFVPPHTANLCPRLRVMVQAGQSSPGKIIEVALVLIFIPNELIHPEILFGPQMGLPSLLHSHRAAKLQHMQWWRMEREEPLSPGKIPLIISMLNGLI